MVYVSVTCSNCHYQSRPIEMTDTVQKARKGPPAAALNEMIVLPALKSKVGLNDISMVLACLNIRGPTHTVLQRKFNQLCDTVTDINEQEMVNSQRKTKQIQEIAGNENFADVQSDTSYSRRPQAGFEKAQQSFTPLIDHTTGKPRVISLSVANKHCSQRKCDHSNCKKSYRTDMSIASSERQHLNENLKRVHSAGIVKVRSVTTDASAQVEKTLKDFNIRNKCNITHYKCFIHRLRTLEKNVKGLNLKSIPKKHRPCKPYMIRLSQCVRQRVRQELNNIRAVTKNDNYFINIGWLAMKNIINCFSGRHTDCRQHSTVCRYHLRDPGSSFLPYGVPLELNQSDREMVQSAIDKIVDKQGLKSLTKLYNTNMCESLHSTVYTYAPKMTCYTRNFPALCHSATHSRTVGTGRATVLLAKAAGLKVPRNSHMNAKLNRQDKERNFHSHLKATSSYKTKRYFLRKRRPYQNLTGDSLYASDGESSTSMASEHNYGLQI